jgi:hypothetical protein
MRRFFANAWFFFATATFVLAIVEGANAITSTFNREVEVNNIDTNGDTVDDDGNRPFFVDNYNNGTITFTNPEGYTGTATVTPAVSSSTVTGVGLGLGGDNTNALPMGIGVNYEMMFSVQTTGAAGGVLTDSGSNGIGVNSSAQQTDSSVTQLSNNEQLLFSNITLNNVSFQDPLGLLMPGATITPKWTAIRSSNHAAGDVATTSTDAAATTDVTTFNTATSIENNYSAGLISPPTGLTGPFYLTTTAGTWSLKGLRYRLELNYELAPVPASRRTFLFADSLTTPVYDNLTTHQITASDTTMTINAVGNGAVFDTNDIGAGINSAEDDTLGTAGQRRIDGELPTPEAIQLSINQDVSLESITVGSFNLEGLEGMRLSFVSGTNPFANPLTGYSSEYTFDANSVTFTTTSGGQTPYVIPFGLGAQDDIVIVAGTILSVTANPSHTDGGIILDMITANLLAAPGVPGDYNGNGTVDAADYVLWREGGPLQNEVDTPGTVNAADYTEWRARFGNPGGGSGLASAVPEPGSWALLLSLLMMSACGARFGR